MHQRSVICGLLAVVMAGAVSVPAFAAETVSTGTYSAVSLQATSKISPRTVPINGTVSIVAPEAGALCRYAFYYRLSGQTQWKCIRSYAEDRTAYVKVSSAGNYEVLVKTKTAAGRIKKEYLSFTAIDNLSVNGSLSAEKVPLGTAVTVAAHASGGNGGYTYSVFKRKEGASSWTTVLKDSTACHTSVSAVSAGVYEVCIKVKDKTGVIRKNYYSFTAVDFSAGLQLQSEQISLGNTQRITASVSEGAAECHYKFYFKNPSDTAWRSIKNENDSDTVLLKPAKTGTYQVYIKAVNTAGNVRKAYGTFTVTKGLTVTHTLSEKSFERGGSLIVTPSSSGGSGKVQYAVYYTTKEQYEAGANNWMTALQYGETGNAVITPEQSGEYVVVTKAKDEKGTVRKTAYTDFRVVEKLSVTGHFQDNSSTVRYRKGITFMADANGGNGQYTYALKIREKGTDQWKSIRDFEASPSFCLDRQQINISYTSQKKYYELCVTVKDQEGFTAEAVYPFTVDYSDQYELPIVPA